MNIKASYRYQIMDHKKSILIFYFVIACIFLLVFSSVGISTSTVKVGNSISASNFSGLGMSTAIFIFVTGLCSFKENFVMLMQNGISRKTLFVGRILASLTVAFTMAVIDKILFLAERAAALLLKDTLTVSSLYEQIYSQKAASMGSFQLETATFINDFLLYLFCISAGYLITIVFYRLNKMGQIAVGAGVPVGLLVILPMLDVTLTNGKVMEAIINYIDYAFGFSAQQPMHAAFTFVVCFLIFSGLSWLLIRKSSIKE